MENISAESLRRLQEEQKKGLQGCRERISQWTKFRDDYVKLQKKLIALPDNISYDVNVPFGSLAFMPGKMVHTNEILVLLGDDWFVERSAKQAAEIVARRISDCEKNLLEMKREQTQYESWLKSTAEVQSDVDGGFEIVEEYDEEKEKLWKEQHRLSVKKQKQMERATKDGRSRLDDLSAKFNELQKLEEKNDEMSKLDRLPSDAEDEDDDDDDDDDDDEDEDSDLSELSDEFVEEDVAVADNFTAKLSTEKPKKVKWKELDSIGQPTTEISPTLKVSFTESDCLVSRAQEDDGQREEQQSVPCIKSPADIYKLFAVDKAPQVRSILKPSKEAPLIATETPIPDFAVASSSQSWAENNKAFSGTIVEREDTSATLASSHLNTEVTTPRRVSKFKAQRHAN